MHDLGLLEPGASPDAISFPEIQPVSDAVVNTPLSVSGRLSSYAATLCPPRHSGRGATDAPQHPLRSDTDAYAATLVTV